MSRSKAQKRKSTPGKIDARDVIQIHAVQEDKAWVHSHGLRELGFAELEIRGVPRFMSREAARIINDVATYMLSGERPVRVGDLIQLEPLGLLMLVPAEPRPGLIEDHYDHERWTIVDPPVEMCECPRCEAEARERGLN